MLELCTGRIPQHPVITSARIDPKSVLGTWPYDGDFPAEYYKCPPNVPLFTTKDVLVGGVGFNRNGKRFRPDEYEECTLVIAHIPSAVRLATFVNASKLIFIGMSYGSVSKNNVVAVVGKGLMPSPHGMTKDTFHRFIGKKVWWKRADGPYGTADGPTIAVPALTARDDEGERIAAPDRTVSTDIFDTDNKMKHCGPVGRHLRLFHPDWVAGSCAGAYKADWDIITNCYGRSHPRTLYWPHSPERHPRPVSCRSGGRSW